MKIIMAENSGFCFGVKRAITMAFKAAEEREHICSLGPIIHSPQVVESLADKGVEIVADIKDVKDEAVILRSHGVTAEELEQITADNIDIVDATCPFVKKAQDHASLLSREGYTVVLVGEADHPEVQGIVSYAKQGDVFTVATSEDVKTLPRCRKIGIVAQTTQSYDNFCQVVEACLTKCLELRVFNTICDATTVRQDEARSVASQVDLMLVIGGHNSANTTRLAHICQEIQPRTYHIETADEIDLEWFADVELTGITAGASTPQWIVEKIVDKVAQIGK